MPKSRIEMNRRRRLAEQTMVPPPPTDPPTERTVNGISARDMRAGFEEVLEAAMTDPRGAETALAFMATLAEPEAQALVDLALEGGWTLDRIEDVVDKLLLAGEALAHVVNRKRDEGFGLSGHAEGGGPVTQGEPS